MSAVYGRGSEWRRWDIHIHAPGTANEDGFSGWDEYLAAIEAADCTIAAIGITDYCNIRAYKKILEYRKEKRLKNISLIIPNIEFRISPPTKDGRGINLHFLLSLDDSDHVQRIEDALSRLTLKRDKETISCTELGLTRLGKLCRPLSDNEAALREGIGQFKVDFDLLR